MCKVPVIIIDFISLDYTMYNQFKSMKKAFNADELEYELDKILNNSKYYKKMIQMVLQDSKKLLPFDGKSTNRFANKILEIIS